MRIMIPSRSRADKITAMIDRIPPEMHPETLIFVPESQQNQYQFRTRHRNVQLHTLSDDYRMAEVRHHMGTHAHTYGDGIFLMVDDDVRFETRRDSTTTRTVPCTIPQTRDCLQYLEKYLRNGRWGMIGLQARQFQNSNPPGGPDDLLKECTRNMCVTGWRTEDFLRVEYRRCVVRSDFDATLQLLRQGRPNVNLCYWQHSQVNNVDGGCADYRTTEIADAAAHHLASLHPGLVTVVKKKYPAQAERSKNNMGERLEVVVKWKQALGWDLRKAA